VHSLRRFLVPYTITPGNFSSLVHFLFIHRLTFLLKKFQYRKNFASSAVHQFWSENKSFLTNSRLVSSVRTLLL
jgi:hypothetical protein